MKLADFQFDLPEHLIARYPMPERCQSRLLHVANSGGLNHLRFPDLKSLLRPGDLLIFNDTRVLPARLFAHKETGGKVEILFERAVSDTEFVAHVSGAKKIKPGQILLLADNIILTAQQRVAELWQLKSPLPIFELLEKMGEIPLPPYMERKPENSDLERYQTVYARIKGSSAAPTAGLHFDEALLKNLSEAGIELGFLTLHVGAGTFLPVRTENILDHQMHREWFQIDATLCDKIASTKARGGRVIAVGTTSVRALESAALQGDLRPFQGDTQIFIYPGFKFKVIDALITNFHLPGSTLMMLVSAFAGQARIREAYTAAIADAYRFYSYGDAMIII